MGGSRLKPTQASSVLGFYFWARIPDRPGAHGHRDGEGASRGRSTAYRLISLIFTVNRELERNGLCPLKKSRFLQTAKFWGI
jgi:hypothetical protein